ncbi:2-oxoglutarate dehydrogenase E1 subunit family protein, partial [Pseudokineococcus marinus]|uniref:2-oxoglutarate dehydrogenase E1 subunit family protein n=1 Tax=Pseudokineococcus marinus TaxID=351215 RepID=UPI003CD0B36E
MSQQETTSAGRGSSGPADEGPDAIPGTASGFGPNAWLVDELHERYLEDRESVDPAWWEFFEDYTPGDGAPQDDATGSPGASATTGEDAGDASTGATTTGGSAGATTQGSAPAPADGADAAGSSPSSAPAPSPSAAPSAAQEAAGADAPAP